MRYAWLIVLLIQEDHAVEDVKKALPKIDAVEKKSFTLAKEDAEKIKKALSADAPSGKIVFHSATATLVYPESGKFKTRTLVTTADGEKGPIKLVVSILPEKHAIVTVKVLDHKEAKDPSPFIAQFVGLSYTLDAAWRPHADLQERRAKAKTEKILATLLGTRDVMAKSNELFPKIGNAVKSKKAPPDLEALKGVFEEFAKTAENAFFLGESKQKRLVENAKETVDRLQKLSELVTAEKFEEAQEKYTEVTRKSCGSCHAGFQNSFRMEREKQGLGNGYFSVGFDLHASDELSPKVQEAIAVSVRRAVLLLELAR